MSRFVHYVSLQGRSTLEVLGCSLGERLHLLLCLAGGLLGITRLGGSLLGLLLLHALLHLTARSGQ